MCAFSEIDSESAETFRVTFDTNPPILTQLGNLNRTRNKGKMVVHGDYVYIFGGYCTKVAERMKIGEWRWSNLASMKQDRIDFGVCVLERRIYLLGGYFNASLEYYDIDTNNFYLLPNIQLPNQGIVCAVIDDLIYAISHRHQRVFNKDFQLIQSQDYIFMIEPWSCSDVTVRGSTFTFIYIKDDTRKVCSFDSISISLRDIKYF